MSREGKDRSRKPSLRKKFLKLRSEFSHQKHDSKICEQVLELLDKASGTWGGYICTSTEPNLSTVYERTKHIRWAFPRVLGDNLQFLVPKNSASFEKSEIGIQEPVEHSETVEASEFAGILVPGVAFDLRGYRLGRGKAFYDRYLKNCHCRLIGIGYSVQLSQDDLPFETHDIKMNVIVTNTEVLKIPA